MTLVKEAQQFGDSLVQQVAFWVRDFSKSHVEALYLSRYNGALANVRDAKEALDAHDYCRLACPECGQFDHAPDCGTCDAWEIELQRLRHKVSDAEYALTDVMLVARDCHLVLL
jgi:hypothetical protein